MKYTKDREVQEEPLKYRGMDGRGKERTKRKIKKDS